MKDSYLIVLSALILLGLGGLGIGLYLFNNQDKNLQNEKPDFIITAIDLQKAFEENEAA